MMNKPLWILSGAVVVGGILGFAFFSAGPEQKSVTPNPADLRPVSNSQPAQKTELKRPLSGPKQPLPLDKQDKAIAQGELISSLFEAGSEGKPEQIASVYAALSHPEAEVRSAAVDVIVQYIGKDGIPKLQAAQASATSPHEKAQIAEAIEFLRLPSLRETHGREAALQLLKRSSARPPKPSNQERSESSRR